MDQKLKIHEDDRGKLFEVFKFPGFGQIFYATSIPGSVRGNHYHTRKREVFCVVEGRGRICMRSKETGERKEYVVSGLEPETVEMPINWVHNIENIGDTEMKLVVWTNEIYNPDDPDTFREEV
jgi:UDP-2-acetamido-2,6-beta-L-arabino-hexul-4-ose reductase